jgi:Bacterial archaeo-eukaryotic release factor family 2
MKIGKVVESEHFRSFASVQGPFVSVYVDDSRDSADAVSALEAIWRDLRKHLEEYGADDDVVTRLEHAILHGEPAVGRQGRVVIATHERVLINEHLMSPPSATVLRISDYPYLVPLLELGIYRPAYVFAAVDHVGADITLHQGDAVRSETVDGGGYPVHKPATAGWNGYGDFQHTTEEAIRMNVRAVAHRLNELVDESGAEVVFVCGEVRSRTDVVSELPERVATRVSQVHAGARGSRATEHEIRDKIDAEFERRRRAATSEIADRFQREKGRGSGLAAEGLAAVCAALRAGDVDTLLIGDLGDATVVTGEDRTTVAPDADVLSEFGEAPYRVARADEVLPFAAIAVGASLVRIDDRISPVDGIAALLRYANAGMVDPDGPARQSVAP